LASVDLEDLVPDLIIEVNQPGTDQYATVSSPEWVSELRNAFWNAHLDGLMNGWTESDGIISKLNDPTAAAMTRDQQQLIILYAYMKIVKNQILNTDTVFRAKAGPVEYETQKSAQVYRAILEDLNVRISRVLDRLADEGSATDIIYIDTYAARQSAIAYGFIDWVGSEW